MDWGNYICKCDDIYLEKYSFENMKFREGDKLTWKLFLEACKEVDNANSIITESIDSQLSFSSIEEAEKYFRSLGGVTVEEFNNKVKEMYG